MINTSSGGNTVPFGNTSVIQESTPSDKHPIDPKVDEAKKLIQNFKDKMSNYPKYMSYEGSMVLCVMLSLNPSIIIPLENLPENDQNSIVQSLNAGGYILKKDSQIRVTFDPDKDFVIAPLKIIEKMLVMFNSVVHPNAGTPREIAEIPIENVGENISVGGKIIVNKKTLQRLGGIPPQSSGEPPQASNPSEHAAQSRQPVSGRNAFEIRTDILQMAISWAEYRNGSPNGLPLGIKYSDPDDIIKLARQFYSFVENKR